MAKSKRYEELETPSNVGAIFHRKGERRIRKDRANRVERGETLSETVMKEVHFTQA